MPVEKLSTQVLAEDEKLLGRFPSGSLSIHGSSSHRIGQSRQEGFKAEKSFYGGLWVAQIIDRSSFGYLVNSLLEVWSHAIAVTLYDQVALEIDMDPAVALLITPDGYRTLGRPGKIFKKGDVGAERIIDVLPIGKGPIESPDFSIGVQALRETIKSNEVKIHQDLQSLGIPKQQPLE